MNTEIHLTNSPKIMCGLVAWLLLAIAIGYFGFLNELSFPAPQAILLGLTLLLTIALFRVKTLKHWIRTVPVKYLMGFHLIRFIGFYFIYLYSKSELPYQFAVLGGCGDIIVATVALILIFTFPAHFDPAPNIKGFGLFLTWNLVGLMDIIFVVTTAARSGMFNPSSMAALLHLPLSLLITFIVPIIIATHLVMIYRAAKPYRVDGVNRTT